MKPKLPFINPFGEIGSAKYVQLTTFTRSGLAKPTPLWAALDPSGELLMWTQLKSWKVKRIRNCPQVLVASCDRTGKNAGAPMKATARILDAAGTRRTREAINEKYGLLGRFSTAYSQVFIGRNSSFVGISIAAEV